MSPRKKAKQQVQTTSYAEVLPSAALIAELEAGAKKAVEEAESLYAAEQALLAKALGEEQHRAALREHAAKLVEGLARYDFVLKHLGLSEVAVKVTTDLLDEAEAAAQAIAGKEEELRLQAEMVWEEKPGMRELSGELLARKQAEEEDNRVRRASAKAELLSKLKALIPEAMAGWMERYGKAHHLASTGQFAAKAGDASSVRCGVIREWLVDKGGFDKEIVGLLSDDDLAEANRAFQKTQSAAHRASHPEEAKDSRPPKREQQPRPPKGEQPKGELRSGRFDGTWAQVLYENVPVADFDRLERDMASLDSLMAVRGQHLDVSVGVDPASKRLMAWANGRSMSTATKAWWTYLVQ